MGVLVMILLAMLFLAFTIFLIAGITYSVLWLFKEIIVVIEEIKEKIEGWRK